MTISMRDPAIEARALDETEDALREFVQAALNIQITPVQVAMMLRKVAADIEPKQIIQ